MARITYVWDKEKKQMVEASEYYSNRAKQKWKNNHLVINDTTDPFISHADKKFYDSKSQYRKELKRLGYEEVGNDSMSDRFKRKEEAWNKTHKEYMDSFKKELYKNL